MDPDESQMQALIKKVQEKKAKELAMQKQNGSIKKNVTINQSRKKEPSQVKAIYKQPLNNDMEIEAKKINKWKFQDLPEDIDVYLTQIYPLEKKLYLTGIMENGQSLNIIANQTWKQIYFVLKDEDPESLEMSQSYLQRALQQINLRIRKVGLRDNQYQIEIVRKQYVFEIEDIPRNMRYYCKVRFSFKQLLNQEIEPTWEGETFKYIIGTTYTPLELLIINKSIKGPTWITLRKNMIKQNTRDLANGLCIEIDFSETIELCETKKQPPTVRVLSFSLKYVIPSQVSTKKYFATERKEEIHIYAISYHFCDEYRINVKEQKPKLVQRTYFLESLDREKTKSKPYFRCKDEADMIGRFLSDVVLLDPDFVICHDSSKILDTLVCRLPKLSGDKNSRSKFGRLNLIKDLSKTNQYQRINKFTVGRLLVDTYMHSKEMVKQIDYELATMASHIKGNKTFVGISDQEAKAYLSTQKPMLIIHKCAEESQLTFNLMNHLEIIQMTRQLSNICGNLWKRSLENKRAERNQFLIMHQCFERDLIIPDKFKKNEDEDEIKKKYQGGMVIEPKKGFKSDYILLLDFNSLYPSIIRQYNVCFSIIDRPRVSMSSYYKTKKVNNKKGDGKSNKKTMEEQGPINENPEQDELESMFANVKNCKSKDDWGFLPQIIQKIVDRRKKCKNMMKKAKNPADKTILDIQQKCYKLVANSIYGCLGFSVSRFYSRPLAALITKKGRDSLMAAKDIAIKRGSVDVIYGDTDSIMLEPLNLRSEQQISQVEKLKLLKKVADELKREINNQYSFLQIDIDGIFKPLILLMKKKYVANKLVNFEEILMGTNAEPKFQLQYKGIQLVRRDGCKIARDTQQDIIKILVRTDGTELEERYNEIYQYFVKLKQTIRDRPRDHFLFSKQLTKNPKDYTNGLNMAHVKVAWDRLKAGQKEESLINHTMYYLICKSKNDNENFKNLAQSAFDIKSFQRTNKFTPERALEIDYEYYKQPILQPVLRLLVDIDKEKVVIDRLSDAFELKKTRRKALYEKFEDNEEMATEKFGQIIGQNLKNKATQLASQFKELFPHKISCPHPQGDRKCGESCTLIDTQNKFTLLIKCQKCSRSLVPIIYNLIRFRMKQMETLYYSNKKRCSKCSHTYQLDPISACCPLQKKSNNKPKDQIAFKMHNFLYLCKQICEYTSDQLPENDKNCGIQKVIKMIDQFLEASEYENISFAMSRLAV